MRPGVIIVAGSRITAILDYGARTDVAADDFGNLVIAPGLVDAHVHVNEPGRTEWEGFATATQAAAAGGVTTVVDMPLNSSPTTTTVAALENKRGAALGKCWVDVGFYGGLIPGNADSIGALLAAGVLGIKAFLSPSGLDEFPNVTLADLQAAAPALVRFDRPLLVHAELPNAPAPRPPIARRYVDYLATRPSQWELDAIGLLIAFCRATGCRVHVVHLASAEAIATLAAAKREGLPITVETCPHYLHFSPDDVPDGATQFKCAPPFRDIRQRELLWEGLRQGVIDTVGSDHSPCLPKMKHLESGDFMAAWGGISSLELTLPIVWTGAVRRQISMETVFQRLSARPAQLVGIAERKGRIAVGGDADFVVWDPEAQWRVSAARLRQRHKLTPYDGVELLGKVCRTYLRGNLVLHEAALGTEPLGQLISARPQPSEA
jgi:allantoinase